MGLLPPLASFLCRTLGDVLPDQPDLFHMPRSLDPLLHFDATSTSYFFNRRLFSVGAGRHTSPRSKKAPRVSCLTLQHFQKPRPFFSLLRWKQRLRNVALFLRSPTFRVWLPSAWRNSPCGFLESLFQPSTLMGFTLQSFSPSR